MRLQKESLIIYSLLLGAILVPVNSTMIAVALSSISTYYDQSISNITWVVTIYLIVMAVTQPIAGKLGDIYGHRRMYLTGVTLFLIGSIGCALAPNLAFLIIFRSIQAAGGAILTPNSIALIRATVSPEKLSKTMGYFGFGAGIGAALGPFIGSILIQSFDWHSIFLVNIPFLFLTLVTGVLLIPKVKHTRIHARVDVIGSLYLTIGIATVILCSKSQLLNEYFIYGILAMIVIPLFFRHVRKVKNPIIDLSLFKNSSFTNANLSIMLSNFVMYAILLIMPLFMEQQLALSHTQSGMILSVFSLCMSLSGLLGARLHPKKGAKKMIRFSFLCLTLSGIMLITLSQYPTLPLLMVTLVVGGISSGIGMTSMQMASLTAVDQSLSGSASGIFSTFRYFGSIISSTLIGIMSGFQSLFIVLMGAGILGFLLSQRVKTKSTSPSSGHSA
ncbi:MFS transporter [Bacillus pumilus]|uniref:MFS transporter n=1 Tax=Bacillus pumilus (strain SAFR-032) TaxID=315750 RepID=A8FHU0_BACP2|nr:MFS transporter [Bacillus pumilus]ABV63807.1 MFS transporter [Bacillus pumilus SAFR-032]MBC3641427.1 MFS transporter [Bacillus pumilus]MBC3647055.1 MFS transporter [Bacillus pumilus]MBC3648251.1 MFS transporter [Bacillus pumilus]MBC3652211.1 MFS transporter [Bacillus pumilus]